MASVKKNLTVYAYVDPTSAAAYSYSTENEYAEMKRTLEDALCCAIEMKTDIPPHDLKNRSPDIYVIDYGGIGALGASMLSECVFSEFAEAVEEHPNTLFIVWSSFSEGFYRAAIANELGKTSAQPNVILRSSDDNWRSKARAWCGLPDTQQSDE